MRFPAGATRAVAMALFALALASCARPVTPATPPAPAGLERFYGQRLSWGPCAGLATNGGDRAAFADPALDCARLQVPLDYAAPGGRGAQIAVLRHRTPAHKIGSLVINPGGPGVSGMGVAARLSGSHFGAEPFDLVGFDPRGTGASTPHLDCRGDVDVVPNALQRFDTDPSSQAVARTEAISRESAEQCVRGSGADVLANSGTRDVARDMDVLRAALGDQKLTYLGLSYGTLLGSTYAEMFPRNVRALVLDGAVDPRQSYPDEVVAKWAILQHAFEVFATDCARRPSCPLGSDPAQATTVFQGLVRPLIDRPLPTNDPARALSYQDVITAMHFGLYLPEHWPALERALTGLRAGDGSALRARLESGGGGPFNVIRCLDGARISDHELAADLDRRKRAAAPFADPGRGASPALDTCAFLPVTPTLQPHTPNVSGLPATLVISTTGDPATPYQSGVNLADELHAGLLTVENTRHTAATQGVPCVDDIVYSYLVDLKLPPPGARCTPPDRK